MSFFALDRLLKILDKFPGRNAFFIGNQYYTYSEFGKTISRIQRTILNECDPKEDYIGILIGDDLETYAAIYAIWFLGKAYIPINPANPIERNQNIVDQTGIRTVLISNEKNDLDNLITQGQHVLINSENKSGNIDIVYESVSENKDCYVLFTSGSTGYPKGVPISRKNLGSFVNSFIGSGYDLNEDDRFLQIYDLSFDASVCCYTVPLTLGACIYTVPQDKIKFLYAYKLMSKKQLTFVKMTPSTLTYLKPYFKSIRLEHLRYCLLGGEAFSSTLAEQWSRCVPNTQIQNVYGPTEATINTHIFSWNSNKNSQKSNNGILSIGKCFGDSFAIIVDQNLKALPDLQKGELCLGGDQISRGYWKDPKKTNDAFFEIELDGRLQRIYRTGDLVYKDEDGDFMFCGRLDSQVQIQGYRVELGEIEKHARDFLDQSNVAVLPIVNTNFVTEIFLFIENAAGKESEMLKYLETKIPSYMLPRNIINIQIFPKSSGGKINRKELEKILTNGITERD